MSLHAALEKDLPKTSRDWQGNEKPIEYPKGQIVARCESVALIQTSKNRFAVVYALQTRKHLPREVAVAEFGECCLHQAACEGLMIDE